MVMVASASPPLTSASGTDTYVHQCGEKKYDSKKKESLQLVPGIKQTVHVVRVVRVVRVIRVIRVVRVVRQ